MRFGCRDDKLVALEHAHFVGYSGVGKLRGLIAMPVRIKRPPDDVCDMPASQSIVAESVDGHVHYTASQVV
jgi:hypothetical protein